MRYSLWQSSLCRLRGLNRDASNVCCSIKYAQEWAVPAHQHRELQHILNIFTLRAMGYEVQACRVFFSCPKKLGRKMCA